MNVIFCWLANTDVSICKSLLENIAYEFVLTSLVGLTCPARLSWMDSVMGSTIAVLWSAAFQNSFKNSTQSPRVISIKIFLQRFR